MMEAAMADETDDVDTGELDDITDDEAEQLLADAVRDDESDGDDDEGDQERDESRGAEHLGDAGKRALDSMKSSRNKARDELRAAQAELKKYQDANKSDSERLQERASTAETRAATAESMAKALQIAMERAPEHATLAQVRAVAKRVRGDDDDALEADADELFEMVSPKASAKTPGRPKERLRGGNAEPDEEPEETDPRKLAAQLPRRT